MMSSTSPSTHVLRILLPVVQHIPTPLAHHHRALRACKHPITRLEAILTRVSSRHLFPEQRMGTVTHLGLGLLLDLLLLALGRLLSPRRSPLRLARRLPLPLPHLLRLRPLVALRGLHALGLGLARRLGLGRWRRPLLPPTLARQDGEVELRLEDGRLDVLDRDAVPGDLGAQRRDGLCGLREAADAEVAGHRPHHVLPPRLAGTLGHELTVADVVLL